MSPAAVNCRSRALAAPALSALFHFMAAALCSTPAAEPVVEAVVPLGLQPGVETALVIRGRALSGCIRLWCSFPAAVRLDPEGSTPEALKCSIQPAADAPLGVAALRVVTRGGISSPFLLLLDDLPALAREAPGHRLDAAAIVERPGAIDGTLPDGRSDYFLLRGQPGRRCAVEIFARRLGSTLDPLLLLLDPNGVELERFEDSEGIGADCRFSFRYPELGEVAVEVRDTLRQGGERPYYRLRAGDFPELGLVYPAGVQRGKTAVLEAVQGGGAGESGIEPLKFAVPDAGDEGLLTLGLKRHQEVSSAFAKVWASPHPAVLEEEPNDRLDQAAPIPWPALINGRFLTRGDADAFRFEARSGERLRFRGRTRSLGSGAELLLSIHHPDGRRLERSDPGGGDEGLLEHAFSDSGPFIVRVEELDRRHGAEMVYCLQISRVVQELSVTTNVEKVAVKAGGVFPIKIACERKNFNLPVAIRLPDDLSGFEIDNALLAPDQKEVEVKIKTPATLRPGDLVHFRLLASARNGGETLQTYVGNRAALSELFGAADLPLESLDGWIGLGILEEE